jgi:hypothetical protein
MTRMNRGLTCVGAVVVCSALALGCDRRSVPADAPRDASPLPAGQAAPPSSVAQEDIVPPAYTGELPPIPTGPFPMARPVEIVRAVYAFAARHPEVLSHVPCFCGCEQRGHRDNDDCFISSRGPDGRPVWDAHGMG